MKRLFPTLLVLGLLAAVLAGPALVAHADAPTGTWAVTGSMSTPRLEDTATFLPDGKVLVAGGSKALDSLLSRRRNSTIRTRAPGRPPAA